MAKALATIDDLRGIAPEFADATEYPDAFVQIWLDIAAACIGLDQWGDIASQGHALLTAHFLKQVPSSSGSVDDDEGREVASKSNGPASVSYVTTAVVTGDGAVFMGTVYGRQWWTLWLTVRGKTTMVAGGMSRWL